MNRLKNIVLAMCMLASVSVCAHEYTAQSVLANGNFVKIRVSESGIYRLTYEEIQSMGLNPQHVRILGYGGAMLSQDFMRRKIDDLPSVPIYMHKGNDNVFGAGDYIAFYAQGPVSWEYTGSRFKHTMNTYSQYGYYFVSDNAGEQLLLETKREKIAAGTYPELTTYSCPLLHEEETVNLIDRNSGKDGGGREWYGEKLDRDNPTLQLSFDCPNIIATRPVRCVVNAASTATAISQLRVSLGNTTETMVIKAKNESTHYVIAEEGELNSEFMPVAGNRQTISMTYSVPTTVAECYLNYVELTYEAALSLTSHYLEVRNAAYFNKTGQELYRVTGATEETQVWNITDLDSIYSVPAELNNGELRFLADNEEDVQTLLVLNPSRCAYKTPVIMGRIANQNLHALQNVDYVIITPAEFVSASRSLAQAHETYDGLTTAVVTAEQVYNEFSSGTPDATAYRWLMKMLYDRALQSSGEQQLPRYLLLMGDGTFDNRKLLTTSGKNILLTYQARNSISEVKAYATDDYFTYLEDIEGKTDTSASMDISVGRLPVTTSEEAEQVVRKLIRYISDPTYGKWKTQLCFLADDGNGGLHTSAADLAAEAVRQKNPSFVVNKIYIDAYQQEKNASGESYPIAKNKLDNLLHNGVLFFDYCGHAGYNNISSEQMITAKEVREMSNRNLGLWMLATCNFSKFDSQEVSAGETAVLNPNGGALGVFAACRTVFATQNSMLNRNFCDALFEHKNACSYSMRVGDAVRTAKNKMLSDENKLAYVLLGDPAIRLHYPTDYELSMKMTSDTLSALSTATIEGVVQTLEGKQVEDFNGVVQVSVLDKIQTQTTLDNDELEEAMKKTVKYLDYPNILFNGEAEVRDGRFSLNFMVPKDIKYNYGKGRMVGYAYDEETKEEAIGHDESFVVGGSSIVVIEDTIGPDVHLYLNNPAFRSGDKTHETPHFYAEIADEHGINTVGNGIGHDLLLIVDNDVKQSYVLNDYFTATANSYQSGQVSYLFSELAEGQHTLSFRAWDLLNNSTTETLSFEVVKGLQPQIFSVMTYPNPARQNGTITLMIQHDKPDATLQTEVLVYDMAGRLVWKYEQAGADRINWNTAETNMQPGIYLYKVQIKTMDSTYSSKTGKIIIL